MTTLTIELSDTLFQQAQQRGFSQQSLEQFVSLWVHSYFQGKDAQVTPATPVAPVTTTLSEERRQAIINSRVVESCEGKPYRSPTVLMPVSSLDLWMNLITEGYEGDALADTEAVYDEGHDYED